MPKDDLEVTYKIHALTKDEDPDGTRRARQLRAIAPLLRRAYEHGQAPTHTDPNPAPEAGSAPSPVPRR